MNDQIDFSQKYDRQEYRDFFKHRLLPLDYEEAHDEEIPLEDMGSNLKQIKKITKLGHSPGLDIDVYEIEHRSPQDPRVELTKETFKFMKQYRRYRVLALYINPESDNHRLSYVTIDLRPNDTGIAYRYSNPRRYSFLLGPGAKVLTPGRYLIDKPRVASIEDLEERFSIEVVNKEFYREIANLFTRLVGGERYVGNKLDSFEKKLNLPSSDETDNEKEKNFAVRMIGRILFCWFLKNKHTTQGNPIISDEILSSEAIDKNGNYYHAVLEKLFFQVLNTPIGKRKEEYKSGPFARVPFLNGGLFEPHPIDDYYEYDRLDPITGMSAYSYAEIVPDQWLRELFELLETYHFTIDENTPMDVELSVDPEMLGRIFENLLAELNPETGETARKQTGSYYTPRPVVEYMVDKCLKEYLLTETTLDEEKLDTLLSYSADDFQLPDAQKIELIEALDKIKIFDPSCGSGAFPMGVLQKMVLLLQKIDPHSKEWLDKQLSRIPAPLLRNTIKAQLKNESHNYTRKLGLIEGSIYGADIQPIAVEISKLRVFLSLVVDARADESEDNMGLEPLPNLEFKFACADTIRGLPAVQAPSLFDDRESIGRLKELRGEYFHAYGEKKKKIEEQFKETQDEMFERLLTHLNRSREDTGGFADQTLALSQWKPFSHEKCAWFDPDWMFGLKRGFDIIVSNPPYIRQESLGDLKNYLKEHSKIYTGTADIYTYFMERGIDLLVDRGIYCIIVSNKWMRAKYGKKLRRFLTDKRLLELIDFGDSPIFDATTYPCILTVANARPQGNFTACSVKTADMNSLGYTIGTNRFHISGSDLGDDRWVLVDNGVQKLLKKMTAAGVPLGEYVDNKIFRGVLTGLNKAFVIDEDERNRLIAQDPNSAAIIKPFLAGRDIKRYRRPIHRQYLIFTQRGINIKDYPAIEQYLAQYKKELTPKSKDKNVKNPVGRKPGTYKWYEIQDAVAYYKEFEKPKIIYPIICKAPTFTYDKRNFFTNDKCFIIPISDQYLLGVLNSNVICFLFKQLLPMLRGDFFETRYEYLKDFPIPRPDLDDTRGKADHDHMCRLVDHMLKLQEKARVAPDKAGEEQIRREIADLDDRIDRLVYRLYNLTEEEVDQVKTAVPPATTAN